MKFEVEEDEDIIEEDGTKGGGLIKLFMFHQFGFPAAIICCTGELCNTPLFIISLFLFVSLSFSLSLDVLLGFSLLNWLWFFLKLGAKGGREYLYEGLF